MKKQKKSFLFGLTFALSAIISCFTLSASAAVNPDFSNATIDISWNDCEYEYAQHVPDLCDITVSGSFESNAASDKKYMVILASYDFDNTLMSVSISEKYDIVAGTNTFTYKVTPTEEQEKLKAFLWTEDLVSICKPAEKIHSLKILAIGNSFSVDAMQWLYDIAKAQGVHDVILGNAYIGGCTLQTHYNNALNNSASYTFYKYRIGNDGWAKYTKRTMENIIINENWDFITLQQQSGNSGKPDSYEPYLSQLISYVSTLKTNPKAKLAWHMTWAYPETSSSSNFAYYENDQLTMYNAIVNTTKEKIYPHNEFSFVIPSGTAIQNMRTSFVGDTLCRDWGHLSYTLGRYVAGLTWFHKITGLPIDDITYVPDDSEITENHLIAVKECVKNAVLYPEKVTQSEYDEAADVYDFENDYTELEWGYTANTYWYSTNSYDLVTPASSASTYNKFIASERLTKEDLPNGTVIVVDAGYKYRPEGWQTEGEKNSNSRPAEVTTNVVVVTDTWWSNYTSRAFNISKSSGSAGTSDATKAAELATHFRIYVPKSAATETATTEE